MILLIYRIRANVPVIIMGETGCGKTALIKKLSQILNNGEELVKTINIHPGITEKIICEELNKINEEAEQQNNKEKEIWIFFDEINTCLFLSLLTEIFINSTYNGKELNKSIRLIGACNRYRRRAAGFEKYGLNRGDDNDEELVYLVQPLPQSLLYYVFSFGKINEYDEKKYIYNIIGKLFSKDEENLHINTTLAISKCHSFLRQIFDYSIVSLREISRFSKCVEFFQEYYSKKNEYENEDNDYKNNEKKNERKKKLYKIKSIICSIYLCYYFRLTDQNKRGNFDNELRNILLDLVNDVKNEFKKEDETINISKEDDEENKGGTLAEEIKNADLEKEIKLQDIKFFSDFIKREEDFLIEKIELNKGIGKNNLLKENVFLLFLSVVTNIPLIIIGKPGTGKSLSAKLIKDSMGGKYSKDKFFRKYPQIIQTYFQGSDSTKPEDVEKVFEMGENIIKHYKEKYSQEQLPISMILFDEIGLAEKSESNPLKVLHSELEYSGKDEGVSFVGISNYSLDAAKINRAMVLSVPNLEDKIDQLIEISNCIAESISEELCKDEKIKTAFELISNSYFEYKKNLNTIKDLIVLKKLYDKDKKK